MTTATAEASAREEAYSTARKRANAHREEVRRQPMAPAGATPPSQPDAPPSSVENLDRLEKEHLLAKHHLAVRSVEFLWSAAIERSFDRNTQAPRAANPEFPRFWGTFAQLLTPRTAKALQNALTPQLQAVRDRQERADPDEMLRLQGTVDYLVAIDGVLALIASPTSGLLAPRTAKVPCAPSV